MAYKLTSVPDDIRSWIQEAARNTGIQVAILSEAESEIVVKMIMDRYVVGNPTWWWDNLKLPFEHFDRNAVKLSAVLPSLDGEIYLIPEQPGLGWRIYKLEAAALERILDNCPLFEYSAVPLDASWFLTESHHDVIYLCR